MPLKSKLVLLLLLSVAAPVAAQARPLAALFPAEADLYVEIREVSRLRPLLDGTAGIYKDPAVAAVLEALEIQQPQELLEPLTRSLGVSVPSLLGMLKGPAAFAILDHEGAPELGVGVAILGVDDGKAFQEAWKKLVAHLEETGALLREEASGGAQVLVLRDEPSETEVIEDAPPSAEPSPVGFLALAGNRLILTDAHELLERTLARVGSAEAPGLDRNPDFAASAKKAIADADVLVYLALGKLWDGGGAGAWGPMERALVEAAGLKSMRGLLLSGRFGSDGLRGTAYVHAPGPRMGLFKIMPPKNVALAPDPLAPADALAASVTHLDPVAALKVIEAIAAAVGEQAAGLMDLFLQHIEAELGGTLESELLALLQPPFTSFEPPVPEGAPISLANRAVNRCRVTDAAKVRKSLTAIFDMLVDFGDVAEKEHRGQRIVSLDLLVGPVPEGMAMPEPAFAVTDTHLYFSMGGAGPIEGALDRLEQPGAPLLEAAAYQRATAGLPPQGWMLLYFDAGEFLSYVTGQVLVEMGDEIDLLRELPGAVAAIESLPDFMRRNLGPAAFVVSSDPSGALVSFRITKR